jgi:hypothetical protein
MFRQLGFYARAETIDLRKLGRRQAVVHDVSDQLFQLDFREILGNHQAHNLKVASSNLAPQPNMWLILQRKNQGGFLLVENRHRVATRDSDLHSVHAREMIVGLPEVGA